MSKTSNWFTADTHFCHRRIIELAKRPFPDFKVMNEALIRAWNERVAPDDVVWHVGDFACTRREEEIAPIFHRLNGTKHLILGNHDMENDGTLSLPWASMSERKVEVIEHQVVCMDHYPMKTWPRARKGAIHLFGHVHGALRGTNRSLDVGVDSWGFKPVSLNEIRKRLASLPPDPDFRQDDREESESTPRARF